ncbi:MAG: HipA family kinase [Limisphaerales bacterium]
MSIFMAAQQYSLLAFNRPTGEGATDSWHVSLKAVAKNNEKCTYFISNEYICAEIGRVIGIPIPPSGLVYAPSHSVKNWFACLNFNLSAGDTLPPVDADRCVAELPELSCGLVLFDILIANNDRHTKNFSVDFSGTPPRMSVFDHSHALFGHASGQGLARLTALRTRMAISGGPVTTGNRHCLLDKIKTDDHLDYWYSRIASIPGHLIKDACYATVPLGMITEAEAGAASDFLSHRRDTIRDLVQQNKSEFKGVQQWKLI